MQNNNQTTVPGRPTFDMDGAWTLDSRVSVRPEPFGALLYHFGTRRLSFLKDVRMRQVVTSLDRYPTARTACRAAGVADAEMAAFSTALGRLAASRMLQPGLEAQDHDHAQ